MYTQAAKADDFLVCPRCFIIITPLELALETFFKLQEPLYKISKPIVRSLLLRSVVYFSRNMS